MVRASLKTKSGTIITVEGTHEEVAKIVSEFNRVDTIGQLKKEVSRRELVKKEDKKRRGASDLIIELREGGFFDKPKGINEIGNELEVKGHLYPVTTLSGVLIGLVRKKLLGRKKNDGKWVYGK